MKPVQQTEFGGNGNCLSACLASLMEKSIDDVPNFAEIFSDINRYKFTPPYTWVELVNSWLVLHGYVLTQLVEVPEIYYRYNLEFFHIMVGVSPRGNRHAVIGRNGKIFYDPHPDKSGLSTGHDIEYYGLVKLE